MLFYQEDLNFTIKHMNVTLFSLGQQLLDEMIAHTVSWVITLSSCF